MRLFHSFAFMTKIYTPLVRAVVDVITEIFGEGRKADKAIQYYLKQNKKFGSRDRGFIAENSYNIVRWWRLLHEVQGSHMSNLQPKTIEGLLGIALKRAGVIGADVDKLSPMSMDEITTKLDEVIKERAVRASIPDWLDAYGLQQLGDRWSNEIDALNLEAKVGLRTNTLAVTTGELIQVLNQQNSPAYEVPNVPNALYLQERQNIHATPAFKEGLFEVQDPGSQLIAPFLEVTPGMRVVDACAGAGGKALHIATLMQNKGQIIAMDTADWKLLELKKRARRKGIHNIETRVIDNQKVIKRLHQKADRVLLDVPCSGSGVLRRNPDAKWKLSLSFIEEIRAIQQKILIDYSEMVKPGGKMVYATCSIFPDENRKQVDQFLAQQGAYEIEAEQMIWPSETGFDGFYMCRMVKAL